MKTLHLALAITAVCVASCASTPSSFVDVPLRCPINAIEYCEKHTATHIKSRRYCRCVTRENAYLALGLGPAR